MVNRPVETNQLLNSEDSYAKMFEYAKEDGVTVARKELLALERQAISLAKLFAEIVGERIVVVHKRSPRKL